MTIARNSLYNLCGQIVPVIVTIGTIPFYIDAIGMARYGTLAIGWLLLGYLGQADFGIGRALTQRIASNIEAGHDALARTIFTSFIAVIVFSLFASVVVYVLSGIYFSRILVVEDGIRAEMLDGLLLLAVCAPLAAITGISSGALMGFQKFKTVAWSNVVGNSLGVLLPLCAAYAISTDIPVLLFAAILGRLSGMLIVTLGVWSIAIRGAKVRASWAEFRIIGAFGAWIFVSSLVSPLMVFADRALIGALINAAAIGVYTIPFNVASKLQVIPLSIAQALLPSFAANSEAESIRRVQKFSIVVGLMFGPLVVLVMVFARFLLELWLGENYDPRSASVAVIILYGFWFNAIANVPYSHLHARGEARFTALVHVLELPAYLVVAVLLGMQFGLAGFATAFAVRCAADCVILINKSSVEVETVYRRLSLTAALIAFTAVIMLFVSSPIWAISIGLVCMLIAIALAVANMPEEIKNRAEDFLRQYRRSA